jgi:hypothetical protein
MPLTIRLAAAAVALPLSAPLLPATPAADECAAMNYLLAQARTEFPALERTRFDRAKCSLVRQEFRCEWGFPGDMFTAAEEQGARLKRCAAGHAGATQSTEKRGETAFQINPETSVYLRGPEMRSGEWTIRLRIVSTADWD